MEILLDISSIHLLLLWDPLSDYIISQVQMENSLLILQLIQVSIVFSF